MKNTNKEWYEHKKNLNYFQKKAKIYNAKFLKN